MSPTFLPGLALALMSIFAAEIYATNTVERSVSPSGQFVIYGGDAALRGAMSTLAERIKTDLLGILRRRDQWATAEIINLQSRSANLPELPLSAIRFSQTPSGLKLQLDLALSRELNPEMLEREILRLILLEMIYRNATTITVGEIYVDPPAWLLDGLRALAPNAKRAPVVRALEVSSPIRPLPEFLRERPELLDSPGRALYSAYSFALVEWLAKDPIQLGRYIDNLAFSTNDPLADLQKSFPKLAGKELESPWRSQIASVLDSKHSELLSFAQTQTKLDAFLATASLDELCEKKLSAAQKLALRKSSGKLMLLAARANPALRAIVQQYQQLAAELALGKNHGAAAKLGDLKKLQTQLAERMTEIDDYLNWFEATQLPTVSGLFETGKLSVDSAGRRPPRRDRFSTYLDAMESQF
ncbi:MAG TPA: hypothetical protein VH170_04730 [Chthoniobacterales bacterium]|jgi:hypothetical protein|nr:hypothetical protein [Chthoniobacterales bacterium]